MNTRGGTIWTATPPLTRHTRALAMAADHLQCKDTIPTEETRGALRPICNDTPPRTRRANPTAATPG